MRLLLFVQTGDGRPRVIPTGARNEAAARLAAPILARYFERWWLVECLNANHGRQAISWVPRVGGQRRPDDVGRILASGGKA